MKRTWIAMTGLALGAVMGGVAVGMLAPTRRGLNAQDRSFLAFAAQSGLAELELSRLALSRAESPDVRLYAERLIADHERAHEELKRLAAAKDVFVPGAPESENRELMGRLAQVSGEPFEHAYINAMVKDHLQAVSRFQQEKERGGDAQVVEYASKVLPKLQAHLAIARGITARAGYPLPDTPA